MKMRSGEGRQGKGRRGREEATTAGKMEHSVILLEPSDGRRTEYDVVFMLRYSVLRQVCRQPGLPKRLFWHTEFMCGRASRLALTPPPLSSKFKTIRSRSPPLLSSHQLLISTRYRRLSPCSRGIPSIRIDTIDS